MSEPPIVSIIIPCMNEEGTIGTCIAKSWLVLGRLSLEQEGIKGEIIVSDNSTDASRTIARSLGATIVIPQKIGYGNAYIEGVKKAKGKYLIFADADNTYDFDEIPKFLKPLMENEADFVMGNRLKGDIEKGSMPALHRYIGNPLLTTILNYLFKTNIGDSHCGMRAITKDAYDRLNLNAEGMEFASEMVIEAARKRLMIIEVPINYYSRKTPSKLHTWGDGWRHLRFMMLYNPTPFFYFPGFVLLIFGSLMIITLAMLTSIEIIRIHSFILGSMLVIIGTQVIITGSYMKIYGIIHDKVERSGITAKLLDYHSLEFGLLMGILLFIGGIILGLSVIAKWTSSGYGSLSEIMNAVISMVLTALGIQTILAALIISIFMLDKKDNK